MRPTVEEQLAGAQRLLEAVDRDEGLSAKSRERLRNAGRLLGWVSASWASLLPFLIEDNEAITTLLAGLAPVAPGLAGEVDAAIANARAGNGASAGQGRPGGDSTDVTAVAARNAELRALLARVIAVLPRNADGLAARAEIGRYLRQRVEAAPA